MFNIIIGIVFFLTALIILNRRKPFKKLFLSKQIGFDMYYHPISNGLRFLIVIPLFICSLYFFWMESFWYAIVAFIIWLVVNFIVASLNSEGAKATKIFNIYKSQKSLGVEKDEVELVLQTALLYYKRKGLPVDYIEQKISDIPKNFLGNILLLVEYILISDNNVSVSETFEERDKRRKIIKHSYYTVFKTNAPFY